MRICHEIYDTFGNREIVADMKTYRKKSLTWAVQITDTFFKQLLEE